MMHTPMQKYLGEYIKQMEKSEIAQAERAEPVGYMPPAALEKLKSGVGPIGVWPVKHSGDVPLYAAPVAITEDDLRAMLPQPEMWLVRCDGEFWLDDRPSRLPYHTSQQLHTDDQMLAYGRAIVARCGGMK